MASVARELMEQTERGFKSPLRKLTRFFESSRDKWKAKYSKLRKEYRLADNKVRAVTKSRERWKQVAEQAQQEARRLREELESVKKSAA
jgi:chromosome segregation ATPase